MPVTAPLDWAVGAVTAAPVFNGMPIPAAIGELVAATCPLFLTLFEF